MSGCKRTEGDLGDLGGGDGTLTLWLFGARRGEAILGEVTLRGT